MCKNCENIVSITWKTTCINYYFPHTITIICFIQCFFHVIFNTYYTHFTQLKSQKFSLLSFVFYTQFTPPTITTNLNKECI
jgi:hypothetical protein